MAVIVGSCSLKKNYNTHWLKIKLWEFFKDIPKLKFLSILASYRDLVRANKQNIQSLTSKVKTHEVDVQKNKDSILENEIIIEQNQEMIEKNAIENANTTKSIDDLKNSTMEIINDNDASIRNNSAQINGNTKYIKLNKESIHKNRETVQGEILCFIPRLFTTS